MFLGVLAFLAIPGPPAQSFHGVSYCIEHFGNDQPNVIGGTIDCDHMYARGATDSLYGVEARDGLNGEAGDDFVYGQNNNDTLYGQSGADYLDGGGGTNDVCVHGGDPGDQKVNCEA